MFEIFYLEMHLEMAGEIMSSHVHGSSIIFITWTNSRGRWIVDDWRLHPNPECGEWLYNGGPTGEKA